jgi:catechol 2,3-dioxygenase-like lactoylglutathione lyase family enzyme
MESLRTHIRLDVDEACEAIAFYQALLGAPPTSRSGDVTVFVFESPPLVLTVAERRRLGQPKVRRQRSRGSPRALPGELPALGAPARFCFIVSEPEHIGDAVIRLRRAGVRLRIEDRGILVQDPDGNAWRVSFVPSAGGPTIVAT